MTEQAKPTKKKEEASESKKIFAKKNFVIAHNQYFREIKTGDDVGDVPEIYLANLKTEGVI